MRIIIIIIIITFIIIIIMIMIIIIIIIIIIIKSHTTRNVHVAVHSKKRSVVTLERACRAIKITSSSTTLLSSLSRTTDASEGYKTGGSVLHTLTTGVFRPQKYI